MRRETWFYLPGFLGISRFDIESNLAAALLEICCCQDISPHDMQKLGRTKTLDLCTASGGWADAHGSDNGLMGPV